MKKIFKITALTFLLFVFFSSCDLNTPETEIIVAQDFMTNVAQVNFVTDISSEASGKLYDGLDDTKSKVTITGPGAASVYNIEGKKIFTVQGGMLQLLLDPSASFDSNNTIKINLIVEAAGFLTRNIPVTFSKDQNNSFQQVAMVKKSDLPDGISIASDNSATLSETTGLNKEIKLTASNTLVNGVTTEITIPAGVKMKDNTGALLSGTLNAEVVSFSEGNNGTAYFPGGLSPESIIKSDGVVSSDGAFYSAGFAAINMTIGSKNVRTFEGGKVKVKMTLSKDTFNPATNQAYQAGDNLDVWSYDTDNGQWKFESHGTVKSGTNGSLYVDFETSHLSYFNLDYLWSGTPKCQVKMSVKWTGADVPVNGYVKLSYVTTSGSLQFINQLYSSIKNGSEDYIKNMPNYVAIKVEYYDSDNSRLLFSKNYNKGQLCGNQVIDITAPYIKKEVVTLSYKGMCSGTIVYPPVGTYVYYKEKNAIWWDLFYYVSYNNRLDGKITANQLAVGKTYDFWVFAGSKSKQQTITIQKAQNYIEVNLPDAICKSLH
nr:hypothetical protein [uncultured Flavobacterium sp.]